MRKTSIMKLAIVALIAIEIGSTSALVGSDGL
jgi:hypothetical protein